MGICCLSKVSRKPKKVRHSKFESNNNLDTHTKSLITQSAVSVERDFHRSLRDKLKVPLTVGEMEITIKEAHERLEQDYKSQFPGFGQFKEHLSELKSVRFRCKAKEVYYRYINDRNSYEHYERLKRTLVSQLLNKELSPSKLIKQYQESSRGTFDFQGLQEMHEIFNECHKGDGAVND